MKNLTAQAVYNADIYLRLSDDDGDKPESNSIKNQREFITEFLKSMPEIRIHAERKDDGFSGVDFFRPGIQEVLQDVRSGAVNCVVVKDLSRLGRNYIETGKVLQEFADHGVRFIAINDGYTNVRTLTRELVDLLIQNIYIYSSTSIEIVWKCGDEYQRLLADTTKKEAAEHEQG